MAVKTPFSQEEFISILHNYNLGYYLNSQPFTQGTVQTNYCLQTTSGKFVFRYYENRSKESVLFESNLVRYLKDKGYPCPAPYRDRHGRCVGLYHGKPYVLFEFIDGQTTDTPSQAQKTQLVRKAADLHNLTQHYQPRYKGYRWNYNPGLARELAGKTAHRIGTKNAMEKLSWFYSALDSLRLPASLPKGICHCDFHFSNILFREGQFAALIDFDDANYTYLTYDLATLLHPFLPAFEWNTWFHFQPSDEVFDFQEARRVVTEYVQIRPLSLVEQRHLFDVFTLSVLFDCIWYFERGEVGDFYEKRKIDALNQLGREKFFQEVFCSGRMKTYHSSQIGEGIEL